MGQTLTGAVRVETAGSIWLIDEANRRYCRFPKQEQPRPESRGVLQDLVWHPFTGRWEIGIFPRHRDRDVHACEACPGLLIWWGPGEKQALWAPRAQAAA